MALDKVRGTDTLSIEPKLERYFDRCKNDFQSKMYYSLTLMVLLMVQPK